VQVSFIVSVCLFSRSVSICFVSLLGLSLRVKRTFETTKKFCLFYWSLFMCVCFVGLFLCLCLFRRSLLMCCSFLGLFSRSLLLVKRHLDLWIQLFWYAHTHTRTHTHTHTHTHILDGMCGCTYVFHNNVSFIGLFRNRVLRSLLIVDPPYRNLMYKSKQPYTYIKRAQQTLYVLLYKFDGMCRCIHKCVWHT